MPVSFPGFSANSCTPFYFQVDPSTGGSLTRCDIVPFTKATFAAQGLTEVGMDAVIAATAEARMAGVSQRSLYDLLLSRHVPATGGQPAGNGSVIAPYTLVPRRYAVNALYFHVTAGTATLPGGFTAGATHATWGYIPNGAWALTVSNGVASPIGSGNNFNSNLQQIQNYFLPGSYISLDSTVRYTGADNQTAVTGGGGTLEDLVNVTYKVHAALNASATTATLIVSPVVGNTTASATDTAWGALTSAQKHAFQVTQGTLIKLSNSVSDYEQWCYQPPAVQNVDLVDYWHQTVRWTHKWNDEYKRALEAPKTSEFWKKFRSLPLAQQRAQQEALNQQDFFNTVFYGDAIDSVNQTVPNYALLPQVVDPYNSGVNIEFKANTLGIRTQLNRCSRVVDLKGGAINLDWIFEQSYALKRERGNTGADIQDIDLMTDRISASNIRDVMTRYYKAKLSVDTSVLIKENQKVVASVGGKERAMFSYNQYWLPDVGVNLNVFTDQYFDDAIGAARALGTGTPTKNRARRMWVIDWSDVAINVHKVRTVKRDANSDVVDKLYNCTMEEVKTHYTFWSKKFDVRVGNPNRHFIIENFSEAQPTVTVPGFTVGA